jgi:hypothetical protein
MSSLADDPDPDTGFGYGSAAQDEDEQQVVDCHLISAVSLRAVTCPSAGLHSMSCETCVAQLDPDLDSVPYSPDFDFHYLRLIPVGQPAYGS